MRNVIEFYFDLLEATTLASLSLDTFIERGALRFQVEFQFMNDSEGRASGTYNRRMEPVIQINLA